MAQENLNIGDLVKVKPLTQSKKFNKNIRESKLETSSPFDDDYGIVVQVITNKDTQHSYVVVHWQKLQKEYSHFPGSLQKVSSVV